MAKCSGLNQLLLVMARVFKVLGWGELGKKNWRVWFVYYYLILGPGQGVKDWANYSGEWALVKIGWIWNWAFGIVLIGPDL
jgi:hypothetical protein